MVRKVKYASQEYRNIHSAIRKKFGNADKCENPNCEKLSNRFEWAIRENREYSLDKEDYSMLCKRCHVAQDSKNISRTLSDADILNINNRLKNGASFREIRDEFSISNDTIRRLYKGKFNNLDWSFLIRRRKNVNVVMFEKMKQMLLDGKFIADVAAELKINEKYIPDLFKALHGKSIKHFLIDNNISRKYKKIA